MKLYHTAYVDYPDQAYAKALDAQKKFDYCKKHHCTMTPENAGPYPIVYCPKCRAQREAEVQKYQRS